MWGEYLYNNTVLDVGMILSVILFVRYRNHFPLSDFKTKHIFGIPMTLRKFLKPWAPLAPPERGAEGARNMGCRRRPNFFFIFSFTAAEGGVKWAPAAP